MCQERLQRSLSLFVFGLGDGREREREKESEEEGERVTEAVSEGDGGGVGGGVCTGARQATGVRRMAGHLAPLWRIMTGCLAITHPHPLPDLHPE